MNNKQGFTEINWKDMCKTLISDKETIEWMLSIGLAWQIASLQTQIATEITRDSFGTRKAIEKKVDNAEIISCNHNLYGY
jgi:hypothetical protein